MDSCDPEIVEPYNKNSEESLVKVAEIYNEPENKKSTLDEIRASVRELAHKLPESLGRLSGSISSAIHHTLSPSDQTLVVHVNDDVLKSLDKLVEVEIFSTRSEAALFLLNEGIKSQGELFEKISDKLKQIEQVRNELKFIVKQD